jgi:hypothetical protein
MICAIFPARFIIHGNAMLPHNPTFYCDECKDAVEGLASTLDPSVEVFRYTYDT